jgi:hypothetical protein
MVSQLIYLAGNAMKRLLDERTEVLLKVFDMSGSKKTINEIEDKHWSTELVK